MKKCFTGIWTIALLFGLTISFCQAKTGYVSDMLILTFREGPGTGYPVVKTLPSNTRLAVMEEENGFYKVTLASGEEGWVDKQFVMFDPPKAVIIDQLTREKEQLEKRITLLTSDSDQYRKELADQVQAAEQENARLGKALADLEQEKTRLSSELARAESDFSTLKAASKNITGTLEENRRLTTENKTLSETIARLENETRHMFRTGMIKWFLAGVGVLLLGWIIGQSVSSRRRRGGSLLD